MPFSVSFPSLTEVNLSEHKSLDLLLEKGGARGSGGAVQESRQATVGHAVVTNSSLVNCNVGCGVLPSSVVDTDTSQSNLLTCVSILVLQLQHHIFFPGPSLLYSIALKMSCAYIYCFTG